MRHKVFGFSRAFDFFCIPLLGLALGACSSVGDDGNSYQNFEQKVVGGTLSDIGLIARDKPVIDYRPRAPLAIPPEGQRGVLPPPQDARQAVNLNGNVSSPGSWPQDPDVARRQLAEQQAAQTAQQADATFNMDKMGRRLTSKEMAKINSMPTARAPTEPAAPETDRNRRLTPDELNASFPADDNAAQETLVEAEPSDPRGLDARSPKMNAGKSSQRTTALRPSKNEPRRKTLTDPPEGYRAPAEQDPNAPPVEEPSWWQRNFGGSQ